MKKTKSTTMALLLGLTLLASTMLIVGTKAASNLAAGIYTILPSEDSTSDDNDGISNDVEQLNQRIVSVDQSGNEFQIESTLQNGEAKDQIEIQIRPDGDGLGMQVNYQHEAAGTEVELSFEVLFKALVEYVDSNANGVYDPGVDTLVKEVGIDSFSTPTYTPMVIDGANVHYIHVQTSDGIFSIHAYIPEEYTIVNGSLVTPTQVKIDIEINSFPYTNGGSDLALNLRLESETDYEHSGITEDEQSGYSSGEEEVRTSAGGNYTGIFSWATTADIDGVTKNVATTNVAMDDDVSSEQKMFICYPRGDHIYHDPKIGVAGILQTPANWAWLYILAGVGAGVVVIGVLILRKRR